MSEEIVVCPKPAFLTLKSLKIVACISNKTETDRGGKYVDIELDHIFTEFEQCHVPLVNIDGNLFEGYFTSPIGTSGISRVVRFVVSRVLGTINAQVVNPNEFVVAYTTTYEASITYKEPTKYQADRLAIHSSTDSSIVTVVDLPTGTFEVGKKITVNVNQGTTVTMTLHAKHDTHYEGMWVIGSNLGAGSQLTINDLPVRISQQQWLAHVDILVNWVPGEVPPTLNNQSVAVTLCAPAGRWCKIQLAGRDLQLAQFNEQWLVVVDKKDRPSIQAVTIDGVPAAVGVNSFIRVSPGNDDQVTRTVEGGEFIGISSDHELHIDRLDSVIDFAQLGDEDHQFTYKNACGESYEIEVGKGLVNAITAKDPGQPPLTEYVFDPIKDPELFPYLYVLKSFIHQIGLK